MPSYFGRFRLLNGGNRLRHEIDKIVYVMVEDGGPLVDIHLGEEKALLVFLLGETVLDTRIEEPLP